MYYSMSRLSILDVRWADLLDTQKNVSFYRDHYNPYYELIVVAEGTVNLRAGDERMTLCMGDSYLLKPWESHGGWGNDGTNGKFFWVQFSCSPGMNEFILNRAPDLNIVHAERTELRTVEVSHEDLLIIPRLYRNRHRYKLLDLFEQLLETMKRPEGYFRFQATLLLAEMFRGIATDFLEQSHLDTAFPISYITFRKLVNQLNNSYESELTKQILERWMDRKYEYLCQVFKKYAGTTINHYIQQLRVQRAKHLLRNTDKSVKTIAMEVGYQEPFYFSRLFKKIEGVSPQHYREQDAAPGKRTVK
ncbi:helix-turn-helix domain-containing protein [Paenibacillus mesophilus]|uniref:AraC family transcriptional regulator n=1 Tax=Paenibacillus mesophilus TaxID=2582849 RepID=UPI00110EC9D0|nr:helix-turn-helix domain-containing protein [Paenibacillus mesophilus]TMV46607.1 helix-turn-helix domain-containing protein [Paenibacillus mesophilus]